MEDQVQIFPPRGTQNFEGGLVTFPNLFSIPPGATPSCLDVRFEVGGTVGKRFGSTTLNATVLLSSAATGFSPDSSGTLANNLVAYWKLDELSGNRLDSFGTNTLTQNNNLLATSGVVGNAASFLAANTQYLSLPTNSAAQVQGQNFWMTAWVNLTSTGGSRMVLSKFNDNTTQYEYDLEYNTPRNQFLWAILNTAGTTLGQTSSNIAGGPALSTWYLLNAWYDSANLLCTLRVDTLAATSASTTGSPTNSSADFNIGAGIIAGGGAGNLWNGLIDEVSIRKRLPTSQEITDLWNTHGGNTYNPGVSNSGWGMFDFGAGFGADGKPLRWLVVAAGTGIYASSNRGTSFVAIATDRGTDFQYFERSKSLLIATSETQNKVLYWAGSVNTFMAALPVGSAPPVKQALDFGGFLLLMNDSANKRRVSYADNSKTLTDPFSTTFELPGPLDDEITGAVTFNRSAYGFTRYTVSRISSVGGNPDFAVQQVKSWGAVPGTIKRVTYRDIGEVMICLGWDRHVRIFDGTEDRIVSTQIEEPNNLSPVYLNGINIASLQRCRAEVDTEEQVYRLLIVMSPSSQTTHTLCLNLRTGAWYPYRNTQSFNAMVMAESGNSRILAGVTRGGFVHWINTTNTDAGIAVDEYLDSPLFHSWTPRMLSKAQKVALYFSPTSSGTLYYQERVNFSTTFEGVRDRIMLTDSTSVTQIRKVIDVPTMQNVYQYRLSSSANTNIPWKLNRMDIESKDFGFGAA